MACVLARGRHTGVTTFRCAEAHRDTRGHQVALDVLRHNDPAVTVRVDCEVSIDDGQTWSYGGGFTIDGGDHRDKEGRPLKWAVAAFGHEPHPEQAPCAARLVRGIVTVTGGAVDTEAHVWGLSGCSGDDSLLP